jgi:electron transport complex protein RnfE
MGLLIALKNVLDSHMERLFTAETEEKVVQRARVTTES